RSCTRRGKTYLALLRVPWQFPNWRPPLSKSASHPLRPKIRQTAESWQFLPAERGGHLRYTTDVSFSCGNSMEPQYNLRTPPVPPPRRVVPVLPSRATNKLHPLVHD